MLINHERSPCFYLGDGGSTRPGGMLRQVQVKQRLTVEGVNMKVKIVSGNSYILKLVRREASVDGKLHA